VPEEVKQSRYERFMAHQQAISAARLQQKIGREIDVLVDEVDEQGVIARSAADAPEIDGVVYVSTNAGARPGQLLRVRVTDADAYDLWAQALEDE
jgi:ribosomal protein S12 methylthiotransferase